MKLTELVQLQLQGDVNLRGLFAHDPASLPGEHRESPDPGDFDSLIILAMLKQRIFSKDEILTTCMVARERAGIYTMEDDEEGARYWASTYAQAAKFVSLERGALESPHAMWLRDLLQNSWSSNLGIQSIEYEEHVDRSPQWCSGIDLIDSDMRLYGITAISGPEGVGKSRLINIAAMLAAEDRPGDESSGWDVVYLEAENAPNVTSYRTQRYWNLPWDRIHKKLHRLQRFWIPNHGVSATDIRDWVVGCVQDDTRKMLIVMDSLHTIVDKLDDSSSKGEGYFGLMKQFLMWLQDARVESKGLISAMIASELNKEGLPKGGKIGYTIDCGIRITEPKTEPGTVAIQVHKSRETKKPTGDSYLVVDEKFVSSTKLHEAYGSPDSLEESFAAKDPRDPDGWDDDGDTFL